MCEWFILRMTVEERARSIRSGAPQPEPVAGATGQTLKGESADSRDRRGSRMKKGLLSALALAALATGLLIGVSSSSAQAPIEKAPPAASGPAYRHYGSC